MASTPHFIERAAVAYSQDLARPPNMSISAYVHMLMDNRLVARDIGLEYIAGYEQARFGGPKNDFSPMTLPVHHHHHGHHHLRSLTQHSQQPSQPQRGLHPHDASIVSTTSSSPGTGTGIEVVGGVGVGISPRAPGEELLEEDYIRFMKVLSLILQGLGWDQNAEDAYEEECREQEREQQARELEYEREMMAREHLPSSSSRYFQRQGQGGEPTIGSLSMDQGSSYYNQSRQDLLAGGGGAGGGGGGRGGVQRTQSSLSGESFCIVDEAELRPYPYPHEGTASMPGTGLGSGTGRDSVATGSRIGRRGSGSFGRNGHMATTTTTGVNLRQMSRSGGHLSTRMSTRSMLTMRTASSTKS